MDEFNKIEDIKSLSAEDLRVLLRATYFMKRLFAVAGIGAMLIMMFFPYILLIVPGIYAVYVLSNMSVASSEILAAANAAANKHRR